MRTWWTAAIALYCLGGLAVAWADPGGNHVTVLHAGYVSPVGESGQTLKVASTITLVQAPGVVLIADPGMTTQKAWDGVLDTLVDRGIQPGGVTHVFISHHHPDHITRLGLFPNATVVDFQASYKQDLWESHADNYELAPGVTVVRSPGHTHEDASLLVETAEGTYALTHVWWSPEFEPEVDPLAEDHQALEESRAVILDRADWIIPGHGAAFRNSLKGKE